MNSKWSICISTLFFLFQVIPGISQQTQTFSGDPNEYPDELYFYMQKNISIENEEFLRDFLILWTDSIFSKEEKQHIIDISQQLINRKAKQYPHFENYLSCIYSFRQSVQYETNYANWEKSFMLILGNKEYSLQKINDYLTFSKALIEKGYLHESRSVNWKITTPDYKFMVDTTIRIQVQKTDLVCYYGRDSILIYDTEGTFDPVQKSWEGNSGLVTWERAGFSKEDVNAKLATYKIDMLKFEYQAEHVVFTNILYFDEPIEGNLHDQVKLVKSPESADYPQFNTYQKNFSVNDLYEDINYTGGLSMQGAKLIGTGNQFEQARVYIYQKDTLRLVAKSQYFAFKANRIDAPTTEISIKLKNDSIFHPGISLSYIVSERELTLYQTDNFTSQSPYFSSYHNIDMTFEQLVWKMDEPYMNFSALIGTTIGNATFESMNYFNGSKYMNMQGMDEVHPLVSIRSFSKSIGMESFLADDFARYLRKPVAQVKQLLMRMAVQGFVYYDTETSMVTIKSRLHDYIAASVDKIDYDAISIPSTTTSPINNAILDLRNYDLRINGIPKITLSESQSVSIYPSGASITMKQNRNFVFDGQVNAGLLSFIGEKLVFNYDSFKIDMLKIDSLHISYMTDEVNDYGYHKIGNVKNLIQDMAGVLYIDEPDNKSGRVEYAQYPVFTAEESGFVYYDDKTIQGGVYKSDQFYFEIYPFTVDSLNNFNYHAMQYEGELVSAGIFPTIHETLSIHSDHSLGFTNHKTPDSGLPVYGGKGYFVNELTLSNKGLVGTGTIRYLTSETHSPEIVFHPDSTMAVADDFTLAKKTSETQFPMAHASNNKIVWYPYQDELLAYKTAEEFNMFDGLVSLNGDLQLKPDGLHGWGTISMEGAEFESNMYTFGADELFADTIDFHLRSLHFEGYTVLADNLKARLDFKNQKGYFNSNDDFTLASFPENKYVSFLDNFEWDMQQKKLAMGAVHTATDAILTEDEFLSGPSYISLDPDQDSLSFISPIAYYDYDSNMIKANKVKYIDIADARIYPKDEKLVVNPNGRLQTIVSSAILANRQTQYYSLYNGTITILAKNKYTGSADYDYLDELGEVQTIHFKMLGVDENNQSIGSGELIEPDHFTLSPNYPYQGKFFMEASRQHLTFDGAVMIEDNCDQLSTGWLSFRSEIDPENIFIPVEEQPVDIDGNRIFNGLYMHYDSVHVYPAFLSGRKYHSDQPLATSSGYLYYNKEMQEYQIASKDKLLNNRISGNLLTINRENCDLFAEGRLNLGADLGQVKLLSLGNATYQSIADHTEMNLILGMDFFIDERVMDEMAYELDSFPNLPATDLSDETYTKSIAELVSQEEFNAMKSELSLFGAVKEVPEPLRHTIMFSELNLKWDDESNSWKSVGKIGIASINKAQINKKVNGLIELQVRRSGDICDIYLEIDRRTWYYFGYTRGVMQVHSSNTRFLDRIKALKNRQRRMKISTGTSYIYMVSTDEKKNAFYRKYQDEKEVQSQENGDE